MGHLHNGILLGHKKGTFSLCDSMNGPGEPYAKWNKPVRQRQILYDFIHTWNEKTELTRKMGRAGWQLVGWERLVDGRIEQKGERTHGHGQQCGDCLGEEGG